MRRTIASVAALLPLLVAACIGGDTINERSGWGVGAAPNCDSADDHCWPEADRSAMVATLNELDEVYQAPAEHRVARLRRVIGLAHGLSHKLTAAEAAALDEESARLDEAAPAPSDEAIAGAVASVRSRSLLRLQSGMIQAHMVPVEEQIEAIAQQGPCDSAAFACAVDDDPDPTFTLESLNIPDSYSPGLKRELENIARGGFAGWLIAKALITNGSLDMNYEIENARLFGEYNETDHVIRDSGLSPTARVEKIISHAQMWAGGAGVLTGAVNLVPFAGIPVSIGLEQWLLFEIHTKMLFRIAQVYGWDIRGGSALASAVALILTEGMLYEGGDIVITNLFMPIVVKKLATRFGIMTADEIVKAVSMNFGKAVIGAMNSKFRQKLAQEAAEGATKKIAGQALGWITLGATAVVSGGADYISTGWLGHSLANSAKRWLGDFLHEGSTFLGSDEARECAFSVYSRIATIDGVVSENERLLYKAYLSKEYYVSESLAWPMEASERTAHARRLRELSDNHNEEPMARQADACLDTAFARADEQHRMVLLAYAYAMMSIDGDQTADERALYQGYRTRLHGPMFHRLDEDLVNQIERTVLAEIHLPDTDIAQEYGIDLRDVIPSLGAPANAPAQCVGEPQAVAECNAAKRFAESYAVTETAYSEGNGPL